MIFIILGGAAFLAIMFCMFVLSFRPASLKAFGRLVCRKDEKIEINTSVASYHRPGERSIEIYCNDYGRRRVVNGRTLVLAFLFSFVLMIPFAALAVILIDKFMFN